MLNQEVELDQEIFGFQNDVAEAFDIKNEQAQIDENIQAAIDEEHNAEA